MVNLPKPFVEKHNQYYENIRGAENVGRISSPGSQYIIQLLKGGYLGEEYKEGLGRKILDVGCGSGFNCVSFAMMGWHVFGCEISDHIVAHARETINNYGYNATIVVGENEKVPFPDSMFDFLLSMNVIHYVQTEIGLRKTIEEYARLLKPGGRLLISTNHPKNWLLEGCEPVDLNRVRVSLSGDYRDGEILYLFHTREELCDKFSPYFCEIMLGENRLDFFSRTLRHWILTAVKQ